MLAYVCIFAFEYFYKTKVHKMNRQSNTANEGFLVAYGLIPAKYQAEVRERIINKCEWGSRSTFYQKMKAQTPIKGLEIEAVTKILAEYNISYNGEYIKQLA